MRLSGQPLGRRSDHCCCMSWVLRFASARVTKETHALLQLFQVQLFGDGFPAWGFILEGLFGSIDLMKAQASHINMASHHHKQQPFTPCHLEA